MNYEPTLKMEVSLNTVSKDGPLIEEWAKIFPREVIESYCNSATFMKQLTTVAVSLVLYFKGIFSDDNFIIQTFTGVHFHILKLKCSDPFAQFVSTALVKSFEAFDKRYLHRLALCFYEGLCQTDNLIEYHLFEYAYKVSDVGVKVTSGSREGITKQYTFKDIGQETISFISNFTENFKLYPKPLPASFDISIRLYYNGDAPAGYQAPGYQIPPEEHITTGSLTALIDMGSVETPHHRLTGFTYYKDIITASNEANATLNPPELTQTSVNCSEIPYYSLNITNLPEVTNKKPRLTKTALKLTKMTINQMTNKTPKVTSIPPDVISKPPEITSNPTDIINKPPEMTSNQTDIINKPPEKTSNQTDIINKPPEMTSNPTNIINEPPEMTSNSTYITNNPPKTNIQCACYQQYENLKLLTCSRCKSNQHAVCYGITSIDVTHHICLSCSDEDASLTPTDPYLSGLHPSKRPSMCVFRMTLSWCLEHQSISIMSLAAALQLKPLQAAKLIKLLSNHRIFTHIGPYNNTTKLTIIPQYVHKAMKKYFVNYADNVVERLLEESLSQDRYDLFGEALSQEDKVNLKRKSLPKVTHPQMKKGSENLLKKYKEVISSSPLEPVDEILPLSGQHNPIDIQSINKISSKRKVDEKPKGKVKKSNS